MLLVSSSLSIGCGHSILVFFDGDLGSEVDSAQLLHELLLRRHGRVLTRRDRLLVEEVLDLGNRRKVHIVAQMAEQGRGDAPHDVLAAVLVLGELLLDDLLGAFVVHDLVVASHAVAAGELL